MASKIIQFPVRERQANSPLASPKARTEALPDWLKELDVEWIFKEEAQRRERKNKR
ncbi:MAG: hypothetical protein AAFQ15_07910 [Pseudomonadota bacterium]